MKQQGPPQSSTEFGPGNISVINYYSFKQPLAYQFDIQTQPNQNNDMMKKGKKFEEYNSEQIEVKSKSYLRFQPATNYLSVNVV